jgi:hypothetical protein
MALHDYRDNPIPGSLKKHGFSEYTCPIEPAIKIIAEIKKCFTIIP